MNKKVKTITTWLAAAIFLLALAINIKVTLDDPFMMLSDEAIAQTTTSSSSETYSGWLWKKKYHDVECGSITWEKTEYYDINDHLVGTTLIEGGIIKVEYNGTYSYLIYSSGTTGNITLQGWQCLDGWNPFCADNINPCDD